MKSESRGKRIWRTTAFVAVMAVVMPMMILFQIALALWWAFGNREKKRRRLHRMVHRASRRILDILPGVSWSIEGDPARALALPAVVVCNHQSHLDLLCMLAMSPDIVFMAKKWVWRNPLYCLIVKYLGCVSSDAGADANLEQIRSLAARGYSTVIFPEGTRSADCRVHRFHQGAFWIASRMGMDIVPVTLLGTGEVMNKRAWAVSPGHIAIECGARVQVATGADPKELRRRVQQAIRHRVDSYLHDQGR